MPVNTYVWENMKCGSGWFGSDNVKMKERSIELYLRITCLNNSTY